MAGSLDWARLHGRHESAASIPREITRLASSDRFTRYDAWGVLADALVGEGAWCDASAPALGLLFDAIDNGVPEPDLVLLLAGEILGGGRARWLWSEAVAPPPPAVVEAALDRRARLVELLSDGRASAAAAMVLAMLVPVDATLRGVLEALVLERVGTRASLRARLASNAPALVRATIVLGLARPGAPAPSWLRDLAARSDEPALVRGAAMLARVRLETMPFSDAVDGLKAWLSWEPAQDERMPWFDVVRTDSEDRDLFDLDAGGELDTSWPASLARAVSALARLRPKGIDELADVITAFLPGTDSAGVATQCVRLLIEAMGWRRYAYDRVVDPSDLSAREQEVARVLAGCELALPMGGYGLAPAGACRRRWIGLDPAGPLERPYTTATADGRTTPLWLAWQAGSAEPMPDVALSPHDRWEAWVQGAASYDFWVPSMDFIEQELARVPHDDELFRRIARLADELAARVRAASRCKQTAVARWEVAALLFLPLVRAARSIDAAWDDLIPVFREPPSREILDALPALRREAIERRSSQRR